MSSLSLSEAAVSARTRLGTVLFTVTVLTPDGSEVSRVHSTHPDIYPVGGRKRTDPTQTSPIWSEQVIAQQRPFLGVDATAVRAFFFDWETIEALGCGAIVNTPVVHEGRTIGSINFLGPAGTLDDASIAIAVEITSDATAAVLRSRFEAFPETAA